MKKMFIGGQWVASQDGRTLPVVAPADGQPFDEIPRGTAGDVDRAVKAARAACGAWGSTTATERERAIQSFQKDDEVRVFLISLKAGGVGLNLTAADYVYIVDPWWNPAVEQQAIDRTHRIGQTKNIFAYRMICKDTIEDKILQLQEKKRALARDLVADDDGFVKTLTREDVEYLFS